MSTAVQSDVRERFATEGYCVLRGYLEPDVIAGVKQELEKLVEQDAQKLKSDGKVGDTLEREPFETRLYKLYKDNLDVAPTRYRETLHLPRFFDLFFHQRLLDPVEQLLGPEIRLYPNYTVRPKFPEWGGHRVLWHQDGGYTAGGAEGVTGLRMVNVWTPLVPANLENGCMQFIPGSHKMGVFPHERREFYLEIPEKVLAPLLPTAVDMVLDPGDVILFDNMLLHQGLPNRTDKIRWSVDWRYQDATQDTMRRAKGHLARSRAHPHEVVHDRDHWASLKFG